MTHDAQLIHGKPVAARLLQNAAQIVKTIIEQTGVTPTLATVIVGDDPASHTYVKMKRKRCIDAGMTPIRTELPLGTTTEQLVTEIRKLADSPKIHGILLQHPVPKPIDKREAFEAIPVEKDVDGVTSATLGRVVLGMPAYASCTPAGIMTLLKEYKVDLDGMHAVVIGRSPILGRPMASMLINNHATVTLCHSRTRYLPQIVRHADILIAAVGKPKFVKKDWLKPGVIVIDAGYNPGNIGDVDFDEAVKIASLITPVPGGVGPMTIATLIHQTAIAAAKQTNCNII